MIWVDGLINVDLDDMTAVRDDDIECATCFMGRSGHELSKVASKDDIIEIVCRWRCWVIKMYVHSPTITTGADIDTTRLTMAANSRKNAESAGREPGR